MLETSSQRKPLFLSTFFGFAGITLCLLSALNQAEALCITNGCSLFKQATVYGISLWWYGAAALAVTTILSFLGRRKAALFFSALFVLGDLALLLLMAFTAPCIPCLCVAVLFVLQFASIANAQTQSFPKGASVLILLWGLLFSPNLLNVANESLGIWSLSGPQQADMQLFFSPSCEICRKAVPIFAKNADARVAFFPVAESAKDEESIILMRRYIDEGNTMYAAFRRAQKHSGKVDASLPETLTTKFNLYRNKVRLMNMGVDRIPVLVTNGLPSSLYQSQARTPSPVTPDSAGHSPLSLDLPPDHSLGNQSIQTPAANPFTEKFSGCGSEQETDCE